MADQNTQLPAGSGEGASLPGSPEDERRRRSRLFFLLAVVVLLCLCLTAGVAGARAGGLFNFLTPPTSTATAVPTDVPTSTEDVTATETEAATQALTTPTDTPSPTKVDTDTTPEVTQPVVQGTCTLAPGDGKCDVRCENTDLDPQDCSCNMNKVCDPGEGFNCPDCSYGQCGQTCGSDADCHNPGLTCSNGVCGGPSCGSGSTGGGPGCACVCPNGKGTCRVGKNSCTGARCIP